ncbi:MAG: TIM barrel protein [Methylococcaceae bacterium]|nr:TIM barrel protein [Methylococcaceae bacterium]
MRRSLASGAAAAVPHTPLQSIPMVFVSTGGMCGNTVLEAVETLLAHGLNRIELSGGRYSETLQADLLRLKDVAVFQVHNYFPPPPAPMVLNLGSLDDEVARATLDHMREAIRWAAAFGRPSYSFHAGFLLDPAVTELGRRIAARPLFDRAESLARFSERVGLLAREAVPLGVSLLIENNVVSPANFAEFGCDPLLMTGPDEAIQVMENTPDEVGLLVDVAHLKVSARTLGFDPAVMLGRCENWIRAYHLSDNDGTCDSNDPISAESWFWRHLKRNLDYYSIEVYRRSAEELADQVRLAESILAAPKPHAQIH